MKVPSRRFKALSILLVVSVLLPLLPVALPSTVLAATTTYYFSSTGNDINNGLSSAAPKKSLSLISNLLAPGVTILLKRGDSWHDPWFSWSFTNKAGTAQSPMVIGAYGDSNLARPIVSQMVRNDTNTFTSQGNNVYTVSQYNGVTSDNTFRLYVGGIPLRKVPTTADLLDNTYCIASGGIINVKSSTFQNYTYVESIQKIGGDPITIQNTSYLTMQDLDIRGSASWLAVRMTAPNNNITFNNIYLHQIRNYGIQVCSASATDSVNKNTNISILNSTIDKTWTTDMNSEYKHTVGGTSNGAGGEQPGGDGIAFNSAVDGAVVRGCTVTNFGHSAIGNQIDSSGGVCYVPGTNNITIEQNTLTAGTSSYCRGFAFAGPQTKCTGIVIRRNYIVNTNISNHFGGYRNYVYSNVFDNINLATAYNPTPSSAGNHFSAEAIDTMIGLNYNSSGQDLVMKDCVIANNTFSHAEAFFYYRYPAGTSDILSNNTFANNIMTDWYTGYDTYTNVPMVTLSSYLPYISYKNNGLWDGTTGGSVLYDFNPNTKTLALMQSTYNTATGNFEADPVFVGGNSGDPARFALTISSPASYRSGGIALSTLLPAGMDAVDYNGATYAASPSLGAFQYNGATPTPTPSPTPTPTPSPTPTPVPTSTPNPAAVAFRQTSPRTVVAPGQTFTIAVNLSQISNAPTGIKSGTVRVTFDDTKYTYVSTAVGTLFNSNEMTASYNSTYHRVSVSCTDNNSVYVTSNGTWATLTFQVNAGASAGATSFTLSTFSMINPSNGGVTTWCESAMTMTIGTPTTGVTLDKSTSTLALGTGESLTATVAPANATDSVLVWTSSDTNVATVTWFGYVSGVGVGNATITATTRDGGYTASCAYSVEIPVTGITLNKSSTALLTGQTDQLSASITPLNATNPSVTWSSDNTAVATVDNTGKITAVSAGSATITATTESGAFTATCSVTVTQPVTAVSLNKSSTSLTSGNTEQLTATVAPSDATNKSVTWSSSNTAVATVSSSGLVTAVGAGSATITVTTADGGFTATCTVSVTVSVTGVSLNKSSTTIAKGNTEQLTATVSPGSASNKSVTWSSSNTSVATVSSSGLVTAVGGGSATITVTTVDGNKTATCSVTVTAAVTGVTLDKTSGYVGIGMTTQLTATVAPSDATNKSVTWSSSNTSIATVNSSGLVTGVAAGSATITVTTADGGYTATFAATVRIGVTGVTVNKSTTSIGYTATEKLTATVSPSNAADKTVTWSSSNTSVATVDSTGIITAVGKSGTAVITVTTNDGGKTASCTVTAVCGSLIFQMVPSKTTLMPGETFTVSINITQINPTFVKGGTIATTVSDTTRCLPNVTSPVSASKGSLMDSNDSFNASWLTTTTPNKVNILFADYPTLPTPISTTGQFAVITFKIPDTATAGTFTLANVAVSTGLFKDPNNTNINPDFGSPITLTVVNNISVTGVSLNKTSTSLLMGSTEQLEATIAPVNATITDMTWTSSNDAVATVGNTGLITAVGAGSATITVTTADGSYTASCTVDVAAYQVTGWLLDGHNIYGLYEGMPVSQLLSALTLGDGITVQITDTNGTPIDQNCNVFGGMGVLIMQGDTQVDAYAVTLRGDVNADGTIDMLDYFLYIEFLLEINSFADASLASADVNKDASVDMLDYFVFIEFLLEISAIDQF